MHRSASLLLLTLLVATPLCAQVASSSDGDRLRASFEARKGDFDYLLGDWQFTAHSTEWGEFRGYWSAVRLATGSGSHILDEYRVVGDSGETYYASTTLRAYNAAGERWELISVDDGSGLQDVGTAHKVGAEMHIEQTFGAGTDSPAVWRIRYYDIGADRFSWSADRSLDGGETWERRHMQLEARRIGPPRSLEPLARVPPPDR